MATSSSHQINLKVRVRPQRVAVLIRSTASKSRFREVIAFLSQIWGGRHCAIIPASRRDVDRVRRRLQNVCPEVVVAVDLNNDFWLPKVRDACQPRVFTAFPKDWKRLIRQTSPLDLILCYAAINQVARTIENSKSTNIRLPPERRSAVGGLLFDAVFGIPDDEALPWLCQTLKAEPVNVEASREFQRFVRTCTEIGRRFTWIDLAANRLDRHLYQGDGLASPPTIIVVENNVTDLALFWSIRMGHGNGSSRVLLPVPRREIRRRDSIDAIVEWVRETGVDSNYCNVTSDSAPSPATEEIAATLKRRLRGTQYRFVDVVPESALWPTMVPFEGRDDEVVSASISNGILSCELPKPALEAPVRQGDVWMVDVTSDISTRRSLGEIAIPRESTFTDVLQAATPPSVSAGGIPIPGLALDGVSFRCSQSHRRLHYQLPTAEEFVPAHLRECGISVDPDEKERRYRAVMELCGGLRKTCRVLLGTPGAILRIVQNTARSEGEITGRLRNIGGDHESQKSYMRRIDRLVSGLPSAAKEVSRRRFDEYADDAIHSGDPVGQVLHKLVGRRVIEQKLRIGRCSLCHDNSWLAGLDLNDRVTCPGCGAVRLVRGRLEVGYSLNPLVSVALDEGIQSVMLTARFLLNGTSRGFLWLPGCKGQYSQKPFDFDVIAICDGRLVVAECKTLDSNETRTTTWSEIAEQFERTIDAGKVCQAQLAVFACQAAQVPRSFIRRIRKYVGTTMHVLFLNGGELEAGHKEIDDPRGGNRWATLDDFVSTDRPRKRRRRVPRTLSVGSGWTQTRR